MTSIISKVAVSSSDARQESNDNTIRNKANDWDYEPHNMFDEPIEDLLNSNVFTVQGYIMENYLM